MQKFYHCLFISWCFFFSIQWLWMVTMTVFFMEACFCHWIKIKINHWNPDVKFTSDYFSENKIKLIVTFSFLFLFRSANLYLANQVYILQFWHLFPQNGTCMGKNRMNIQLNVSYIHINAVFLCLSPKNSAIINYFPLFSPPKKETWWEAQTD